MKKIKKVLVIIYLVSANMKKIQKEVKKIWYSNEDIKKIQKLKAIFLKMKRPHIQNITPFLLKIL